MSDTLPAVILAAGGSTRMGSPKALAAPDGGDPALQRVVAACREGGCEPVLVVTGSDAAAVGALASSLGATVVENPAWERGRSTSVKACLPHLPSGCRGLLLFPVDHPLVEAGVVRALREAFLEAEDPEVALPLHEGGHGHPIVIAAGVFPELAVLGDDQPLRDVVRREGRRTLEVPVDSFNVHRNLDEPGDWEEKGL
ncbi:MAG: nucleotidyltransferase family protein [Planctomycetota bacterium]|jgi:molybdenum cofactor cytidylyltransferase